MFPILTLQTVMLTEHSNYVFGSPVKRPARNEPRRWTSILVNTEMAYPSITPYAEFLMNSQVSLQCRRCIGILTALTCFLEANE